MMPNSAGVFLLFSHDAIRQALPLSHVGMSGGTEAPAVTSKFGRKHRFFLLLPSARAVHGKTPTMSVHWQACFVENAHLISGMVSCCKVQRQHVHPSLYQLCIEWGWSLSRFCQVVCLCGTAAGCL